MKLELQLFIREHRSGCFTVQVVGDEDLSVFTDDLPDARQDLALVITDRIERTHPASQSRFGAQPDLGCEELEIEESLWVEGEEKAGTRTMKVSALVSRLRSWTSVWIPMLDLRFWLDAKNEWKEQLLPVIASHLTNLRSTAKLEARFERREWVEKLAVDAEPPKLSAFTGKHRHADMLPLPSQEDPEEPEQAQKKPTPALESIAVSLTRAASEGELERAQGRLRELTELTAMLEKPTPSVIAIVGPSGVGKTAILDELVHRLRSDGASVRSKKRDVWFADSGRLIAGEGFLGEWQGQVLDVARECEETDAVWYIGSILALLDAGKTIHSDQSVAMLLKPLLIGRRITVIGECTDTEWAQLEVRDVGMARAFTPYRIEEPSADEARAIVAATARDLEAQEGVLVTPPGLSAVMELCRRYATEGSRLGAAVQFLRRAVERMVSQETQVLDRRAIVSCFSAETGLPELVIRDDLRLDPERVRQTFAARVIGQEQAVDRMVDLIAVIKAGVSDLSKPLGSFLFVGPTGVGKTEMAKALASFLFGSEGRLMRFDMSEYVGLDAVHRFLGDRESEGKLVESIRRSPFSVVLLDEIEKAHPAVFDVLLQVLGEARLTDEGGRTAHFENAVIVMTSNLGVESFKRELGFGDIDLGAAFTKHFSKEAERFFRPELFNRIDHVVPFLPLEAEQIGHITQREVAKFLAREGIKQRNLMLEVGPEIHEWLAERGVDPRYGARPLKRAIERNLAIPLARRLSSEDLEARRIGVRANGESLHFEVIGERERAKRGQRSVAAIESADLLLFRDRVIRRSRDYRELEQEVRLIEQLSHSRQFWENRELAEARTRSIARDRLLLDEFAAHRGRLQTESDLAYDAYFSGGESSIAKELVEQAQILELRLFARRVSDPDRAILYFDPAKDSRTFERELIVAYNELGETRSWKVTLSQACPIKSDDQSKKKDRRAGAWEWKEVKWVTDLEGRAEETLSAMVVEGPFAGALLSTEGGLHSQVEAGSSLRVKVHYDNSSGLKHPNHVEPSNARRRTFNRQRWVAEDHLLQHQRALSQHLSPVLERFVSQVPALAVLGARDRAWYDALGI